MVSIDSLSQLPSYQLTGFACIAIAFGGAVLAAVTTRLETRKRNRVKDSVSNIDGKLTPIAVLREQGTVRLDEADKLAFAQQRFILPAYQRAKTAGASDDVVNVIVSMFVDSQRRIAELELVLAGIDADIAPKVKELGDIFRGNMELQRKLNYFPKHGSDADNRMTAAQTEVMDGGMIQHRIWRRQEFNRTFRTTVFHVDPTFQPITEDVLEAKIKTRRDDGQIVERLIWKYQRTLVPAVSEAELLAAARAELDRRLSVAQTYGEHE